MGLVKAAAIEPNARVVLEYTLRRSGDSESEVLDASDSEDGEPIVYIHGYGMLVPGLEKALAGLSAGETKDVIVSPEEGFGDRDEELVLEIDRSEVPRPDAVAVGDELVAESPEGDEAVMRVIEVKPETVVIDGNHPLAGETLHYSIRVREVRPATEEEIEQAAAAFEEAGYEEPLPLSGDDSIGGINGDLVQLGRKRGPKLPN